LPLQNFKYFWLALISLAALALATVPVLTEAQAGADSVVLEQKGPHPVRDLFFDLAIKYNWLVTVEEGPQNDLVPKTSPTGLTVMVKRTNPVSVALSDSDVAAQKTSDRVAVVEKVLAAYYAANPNANKYTAVTDGDMIHVVPVQYWGSDGVLHSFDPLLGTKISFPAEHFDNLYDFVERVIGAVAAVRGTSIVLAPVPNNYFRQNATYESADNEPASAVLNRAFWRTNGRNFRMGVPTVGLLWFMAHDPSENQYWLSVAIVSSPMGPSVKAPTVVRDTKGEPIAPNFNRPPATPPQ
jgi:hypothetical protein